MAGSSRWHTRSLTTNLFFFSRKKPSRLLPTGEYLPALPCIDRKHSLQVFRDMVNTFSRLVGPFKNEVHRALEKELYQDGTPP